MKSAASYFAFIFGTGFVLGILRVLWLVPLIGTRNAELVEIPLMFIAIVYAARFIHRRFPKTSNIRTGLWALAFLLAAEIILGMALTGASPLQILFDRDPISGTAYYAALAAFAVMPWWIARK